MICPHCKKRIFKTKEREILNLLKKGELSIVEISKKLNIKRSTLIYYIKCLKEKNLIKKNRIEFGKKGRPTLIKLK